MFDKEFLGTSLSATPGSKGVALPPFLCNQWCQHQIEAASYTSRPRPVQSEMISEEVCSTGLLRKALTVQSHQEGTSFWGNLLRRVSVGDTIWRGHVGPCPLGGFPYFFFFTSFSNIYFSYFPSFFLFSSLPPSLALSPSPLLSFFRPSFFAAQKGLLQGQARRGLPWWLSGKESTCQCRRHRFDPWSRKIPWRKKWQPLPPSILA